MNVIRTLSAWLMMMCIGGLMLMTLPPDPAALSEQLQEAARKGDMPRLEWAIQHGANVNARDEVGVTPLFAAVRNGQAQAAERLLRAGANVNARGWKVGTPLLAAALFHQPDCARVLLTHGADPDATDDSGNTALHLAQTMGADDVIELLTHLE